MSKQRVRHRRGKLTFGYFVAFIVVLAGSCGTSYVTHPKIRDVAFSLEGEPWVVLGTGRLIPPQSVDIAEETLPEKTAQIEFIGQSHGWLLDWKGKVYGTEDGGRNWSLKAAAFPVNSFYAKMDFINERIGLVSHGPALYRTVDGGSSWRKIFPTEDLQRTGTADDIRPGAYSQIDANIIWLVTQSKRVFVSTNGGAVWNETNSPVVPGDNILAAISEEEAWVGNAGLSHTTDGGRTWRTVSAAQVPHDVILTSMCFSDAGTGWAVGWLSRRFRLIRGRQPRV